MTVMAPSQPSEKKVREEGAPSPRRRAGRQIPKRMFKVLLLKHSAVTAAPRPCFASRTAATALGIPVKAAMPSVPAMACEMENLSASQTVAPTIPRLPHTIVKSAGSTSNQ